MHDQAIDNFRSTFRSEPGVVASAPGRVNLIGEHTDYNDGFVLPIAINRAICWALRPIQESTVKVCSTQFNEELEFDLDQVVSPDNKGERQGQNHWLEYIKAVAWALQDAGHRLTAFEGVVAGDVPIGAGLASSAALEVATAMAFVGSSNLGIPLPELALSCQRAENQWVGVPCGIMDQYISAMGQEGHAMLLDCQSRECKMVPMPSGVAVVILDTGTRRGLVDSEYRERRESCESAAGRLGAKSLREVTTADLRARQGELDKVRLKRARHVVTEIVRTKEATKAMEKGNVQELGRLMNDSHASLQYDFEVSTEALDTMVESAHHIGCYGARLTGAGFGGCGVALVAAEEATQFAQATIERYKQQFHDFTIEPTAYVCQAAAGAEVKPF